MFIFKIKPMKKTIVILVLFTSIASCKKNSYSVNQITQEEFSKLETKNIQLLDVRTPEEFNEGFIEGAISINFYDDEFFKKVNNQFDSNKPIYIYCASSGRSVKASSKLIIDRSFTEIYYLQGGYNQWKKNQE
mgnify:FL=1|tara:strand:- start:7494 stop:7892 length:399 start_codon:yes stop_codon:yes gene_type:complete